VAVRTVNPRVANARCLIDSCFLRANDEQRVQRQFMCPGDRAKWDTRGAFRKDDIQPLLPGIGSPGSTLGLRPAAGVVGARYSILTTRRRGTALVGTPGIADA
jgi:hypothetical protein